MSDVFSKIADPTVEDDALEKAIAELGPVSESSRFWSEIIKNPRYSESHRKRCFTELFRRFIRRGMPLSELPRILESPSWINEDISYCVAWVHFGPLYVKRDAENSLVFFLAFPMTTTYIEKMHFAGHIHLLVEGEVDDRRFQGLMRGNQDAEIQNRKILRVGGPGWADVAAL